LKIEGYSESLYFAVCPLSSYDVILGKQWLSKYDPLISHKTNKITFHFGNQPIIIQADLERHKSLVSASTFARAICRGFHTFALLLNPDQPSATPTVSTPRVKTLLEEFYDIFPDDLPKGLPPQRSHDFKIELQPDAAHVKKGLYRQSAKETEELKKQLHDLLENTLYNPVQAHGAHPSYLSTKRMEDSVSA
jgi:hypothetical protein